jgi:hypothetical protein
MPKMTVAAAALLFGTSSLALAQTLAPVPSPGPGPFMQGAPGPGATTPTLSGGVIGAGTEVSGSSSALANEAQVKEKLEADGYRDVSDIKGDANGWTALAMFNGKRMTVTIDNAGKIDAR